MDDAQLIRAMRDGDPVAFESLYRRHKDRVFRYACALGGNAAAGEDLVQEAFLGFLRNVDGFVETRPLLPYLLRSVRNRHLDQVRSFSGGAAALPEWELTAPGGGPEAFALESERTEVIAKALAALPDLMRETVTLRIYGNMGYEGIAELYSVPAATVRTRYRAALKRLRSFLGRRILDE